MSDVRCHVRDNVRDNGRDNGRDKNIEASIILYDTASYKCYGREVGIFNQPYPCCRVALQRCNKEYNT